MLRRAHVLVTRVRVWFPRERECYRESVAARERGRGRRRRGLESGRRRINGRKRRNRRGMKCRGAPGREYQTRGEARGSSADGEMHTLIARAIRFILLRRCSLILIKSCRSLSCDSIVAFLSTFCLTWPPLFLGICIFRFQTALYRAANRPVD